MNLKNNYFLKNSLNDQREKPMVTGPNKKVICKIVIIDLIPRYTSGRLMIMVMVKIYMKF